MILHRESDQKFSSDIFNSFHVLRFTEKNRLFRMQHIDRISKSSNRINLFRYGSTKNA